ncbi:MAG: hypothetical protein ACRCWI_02585 [Brevinema sp.]
MIKFFLLWMLAVVPSYTMMIKDSKTSIPKQESISSTYDIVPPYNPYSLYVPSKEALQKLPPERVLDMGASAYSANFYKKSLYFYTNAAEIFIKDPKIIAWAMYEAGFIYANKRQYSHALTYFDQILNLRGAPTTVQNLARMMSARIRNRKEYKVVMKQEDLVFLADKKAQSLLDKQIAKEERVAEKTQRQMAKERKRREKEEKRLLKEAEKIDKKSQKEEFEKTS